MCVSPKQTNENRHNVLTRNVNCHIIENDLFDSTGFSDLDATI